MNSPTYLQRRDDQGFNDFRLKSGITWKSAAEFTSKVTSKALILSKNYLLPSGCRNRDTVVFT